MQGPSQPPYARLGVAVASQEVMMGQANQGSNQGLAKSPMGVPRRLFFRETCLGEITQVEGDFPWVYGKLTPTSAAAPLQDFFRWMGDEENVSKEPPFEKALLNEDNWSIVEENGEQRGISMPAIHEDGLIAWRWRGTRLSSGSTEGHPRCTRLEFVTVLRGAEQRT